VSEAETVDPIKAKLLALKEKREAIEAKREERIAKLLPDEMLAEAERALADEEALEAAEAEHGPANEDSDETTSRRRIAVVRTSLGIVILKRAEPVVMKAYRAEKKDTPEVTDKFVKPCLIYPDRRRFNEMVEEQPFILDRCANAIGVLAGVRVREVAGK
jgi:hypothetical protein